MRVSEITTAQMNSLGNPVELPRGAIGLGVFEKDVVIARCGITISVDYLFGMIGWFESIDSESATKLLLETAIDTLRRQGVSKIIGPMDGDSWHRYRFVNQSDNEPFFKEPTNPLFYPKLWESAGFVASELYETRITDSAIAASSQEKFYRRAIKNGYRFETITPTNFNAKIPVIYDLSVKIFVENLFYSPISLETCQSLYAPAKAVVRPGLSWIAYRDDRPVGFVFAYPDYQLAYESMRGKSNWLAKLRFLLNRSKANRLVVKTLGVLPEVRHTGVSAALTFLAYSNGSKMGYRKSLMALMHASNDSKKFGGSSSELYRTYTLYEAP